MAEPQRIPVVQLHTGDGWLVVEQSEIDREGGWEKWLAANAYTPEDILEKHDQLWTREDLAALPELY